MAPYRSVQTWRKIRKNEELYKDKYDELEGYKMTGIEKDNWLNLKRIANALERIANNLDERTKRGQ